MSLFNSLEIEEIVDKTNVNNSLFVFHHLPDGMGITIGNYLRRLLLGYISGVAPAGVKITDKNGAIKSKITTLAGVKEVTPFLIMNLKKIVLAEKKIKAGLFCLELKLVNNEKNERIITAGDFQEVPEIEIKNPELYLATLAPGNNLEIKMYCQKNWGYHSAENQKKINFVDEEDIIIFDTDYSPIKGGQVNFQVKPVIIGLEKQEEELHLTINTNGAIKPRKLLKQALEISQSCFDRINEIINNKKEKIISETK